VNAIRLIAAWVAAAMDGAVVSGDLSREFGGVSIDNRTAAAGELFIAIRGERFDGAAFAAAAIEAGAGGVVVPRGWTRRGEGTLGPDGARSAKASPRRVSGQVAERPPLA
jgi:UDP-N-acetylmuramyl pentapeptide synthase